MIRSINVLKYVFSMKILLTTASLLRSKKYYNEISRKVNSARINIPNLTCLAKKYRQSLLRLIKKIKVGCVHRKIQ